MLTFTKWMQQRKIDEAWLMQSLRDRFKRMQGAFATEPHVHPVVKHRSGEPMAIDYTSPEDMKSDVMQARQRAAQLNQQPGGVNVYMAIVPNNAVRPIQQILAFNLKPPDVRREVAVSVNKGLWMEGLVLVGKTKKLITYYPTDVRTKQVPLAPGSNKLGPEILPTQAHRPANFRHYDEATVRIGDIQWHTIYYDPDDEFFKNNIGSEENLRQLVQPYGIEVKRTDRHVADPMISSRYSVEVSLRSLIEKNVQIHQLVIQASQQILSEPHQYPSDVVEKVSQIHDEVSKHDPTHKQLRDHAINRLDAVKKSFMWLKQLFQYLHSWIRKIAGGLEV